MYFLVLLRQTRKPRAACRSKCDGLNFRQWSFPAGSAQPRLIATMSMNRDNFRANQPPSKVVSHSSSTCSSSSLCSRGDAYSEWVSTHRFSIYETCRRMSMRRRWWSYVAPLAG
jgi:hypothetical protein